jgi:hypothetical protein
VSGYKVGDEVRGRWPAWGRGPDKCGEPTKIARVLKTRIECKDGSRWQPNGYDTYPASIRGESNYKPRLELMSDVRRRFAAERPRALDGRLRSLSDDQICELLTALDRFEVSP